VLNILYPVTMTLSATVCLSSLAVIALLYHRKLAAELNLILMYAIICLIYYTSLTFIRGFYANTLEEIEWIIHNLFVLIEFIVLALFVRIHLTNDNHSRAMLLFLQLFPLVVCYAWLYNDSLHRSQPFITLSGALLLIAGCLLFYTEIIAEPPDAHPKDHITFMVINGIFILSAVTFAMSASFLDDDNDLIYSIIQVTRSATHLILFTLLFIQLKWQKIFLSLFPV
jgi:hypothetical protein